MEILTFLGRGYDCNSYLIKDRDPLLVDVGTGSNNDRLVEFISMHIGTDKLKRILLTHTHYDHAGGAAEIAGILNAEILVHPLEGKRISSGDMCVASACFGESMKRFPWSPVEDGDILDTGSARFRVLHVPGHSEGCICLWDEDGKSLISGDTVFSDGGIGRYDLPSGELARLRDSIRRISKLGAKNLYPGHGKTVIGEASEHISTSYELVRGGL
jgi:glyoxylase-like metal-dependent hydrolase (beta-lactamase superfamily II)